MIREFTKTVGRFSKGQRLDYPLQTWEKIARDAGDNLTAITVEVALDRGSNSMTRIFTKSVGRFAKGEKAAYPPETWTRLAADAKMKLDEFTALENSHASTAS